MKRKSRLLSSFGNIHLGDTWYTNHHWMLDEISLPFAYGSLKWVCMLNVPCATDMLLIRKASQCISATIVGIAIVVFELSFIMFHFIFHYFFSLLRFYFFPFCCKNRTILFYYFHCCSPSLCAWRTYKHITNADKINFFNELKTTHIHAQ